MNSITSNLCPLCQEQYDTEVRMPIVLECGHTTCSICIDRILQSQGLFHCIVCGKDVTFDSILRSPVNFAMVDILNQFTVFKKSYDWHSTGRLKSQLTYKEKIMLEQDDKCLVTSCFNPVFIGQAGERQIFCSENCMMVFQRDDEGLPSIINIGNEVPELSGPVVSPPSQPNQGQQGVQYMPGVVNPNRL